MKSYACYVHVTGEETPHLRFVNAEAGAALRRAVGALVHEWPQFETIDVCDDHDHLLAHYTQLDRARLTRH